MRREFYIRHHTNQLPARSTLRRIARTGATLAVTLTAIVGVGLFGISRTNAQAYERPHPTGPQPSSTAYGSGKLTVAVVLGASGTIGTDAMGPYEVFASSPEFTVYTVAARREPVPVRGAPWIVPAHTFADAADGSTPAPDVVVIPAFEHPDSPDEAPARAFIAEAVRRGARILSVCNGAHVLAATGLLDEHPATAHWSRLRALRKHYPHVDWVAGRRYVDSTLTPAGGSGEVPVTSTAGITSGIAGALHVLAAMTSNDEALHVQAVVRYPDWSPGGSNRIPAHTFALSDLPALLNLAFPWGRGNRYVRLSDGVGEIATAARFEVATTSNAERLIATAPGGWVTTAHGMVLATQHSATGNATREQVVPAKATGFGPMLDQVTQRDGAVAGRSVAKMVEYPYTAPHGAGAYTWRAMRAPGLAALLTGGAVFVGSRAFRGRRPDRKRPRAGDAQRPTRRTRDQLGPGETTHPRSGA